jgi:hypothetical protein
MLEQLKRGFPSEESFEHITTLLHQWMDTKKRHLQDKNDELESHTVQSRTTASKPTPTASSSSYASPNEPISNLSSADSEMAVDDVTRKRIHEVEGPDHSGEKSKRVRVRGGSFEISNISEVKSLSRSEKLEAIISKCNKIPEEIEKHGNKEFLSNSAKSFWKFCEPILWGVLLIPLWQMLKISTNKSTGSKLWTISLQFQIST